MENKNKHEIIVKVEKTEWDAALEKSFTKSSKEVKVDGFRKGKIPRDIYEKKFGKESLYMDAVDLVLPNAYKKALEESKLIPVVQPQVDIKSIAEEGVEVSFSIITKPTIKLGEYKKLNIEKPISEVTNEEINAEIEKLIKQYSEVTIKEGKIKSGDVAVIDFEGFKDGVAFTGGKGEDYPLEIGSNAFIPGFEEQLIGMKKSETKDIEVTFPKEYQSEDLKGKKVSFKVTIKEVKEKTTPKLNENFFKDLAIEGVDSKETLEKELETRIQTSKEVENENIYIDSLLDSIAKNVEVEIPEEMIKEEVDRMIGRYKEQLKMQGIEIEQYYQITNTKEEDLRIQMGNEAKKHVTYRIMLEEIAKQENIEVSEEDASKEAEVLAAKYQMSTDEFLKLFGGSEMIKYDLQMRKTIELLKENN